MPRPSSAIDFSAPCDHAKDVKILEVRRPGEACTDCLAIGGQWVHLRECLECGHVACCDDSPNRHATKHFSKTQHPVMTSVEAGETWAWCFVDERMLSE